MSKVIVEEQEYDVEVSGIFSVFAESQEQANEYIENQLHRRGGYVEQLDIYSPDYEEQDIEGYEAPYTGGDSALYPDEEEVENG